MTKDEEKQGAETSNQIKKEKTVVEEKDYSIVSDATASCPD